MRRLIWSAFALLLSTAALADSSTINPGIPAQGAPLQSAPIRGNFLAAYNDINRLFLAQSQPSILLDNLCSTPNAALVRGTLVWQCLTSANNSVWVTNGSGVPSIATTLPTAVQNNITTLGGSPSIKSPTFQDGSDATKQLQFNLSAVTTGTTRTWALPNVSDTFVGLTGSQTLTNKTINGASNTLTVLAGTQLSGATPIANGGSGQTTALAARASSGFNIDAATSTGDANYTVLSTDRLIYHTALSAARTDTLPAANAVNVGQTLYIIDPRGVATASFTVTVQKTGSDTVNGTNTYTAIVAQYGAAMCWSDGSSRWTCTQYGGGAGGGVTSFTVAAGTGLSVSGTCTVTTTGTCTPALNLAANDTWTGAHIFNGSVAFGSGFPWIDVMSGANGCTAAVGNNAAVDTPAIQCQLNYMHTTFGGGIVYIPRPNNHCFLLNGTLTVYAGTTLVGTGINASCLSTNGADAVAVSLVGGSAAQNGIRDLLIQCNQTTGATQICLYVDDNTPSMLTNVSVQGGYRALETHGVDGRYIHLILAATSTAPASAHLFSRGSNFYYGGKFDGNGPEFGALIALPYTTSTTPMENQFSQTDFSGTFGSAAFAVDDGGNPTRVAVTKCVDCIFGGPIIINNSVFTAITSSELSSIAHNGGALSIASSYGFGGVVVSGAGAPRSCAANVSITC